MPAELAHQKADKHLCVELHRKVRIRLRPSMALQARICAECCHVKRINQSNMEILRNNRLINDIVNVSCQITNKE